MIRCALCGAAWLWTLLVVCGVRGSSVATSLSRGIGKEIAAVKQPVEEAVVSVGSSQCSNVKKLLGVAYEQIDGEKEPDLDQLKIALKTHEYSAVYNISSAARGLSRVLFDHNDPLVLYVHGFTDDPSKSSFTAISDAYLKKGKCTILALDASSLIHWLYLRSTTYVQFIGEKLGEVLAAMYKLGVPASHIHVIGHSLGSHICGFTGKTFRNLTGSKLGRISGLDPAGPCFTNVDRQLRLIQSDADYVDVIHTDANIYGLEDAIGHIDYYPNSGSMQPNCVLQTCSHSRAWEYYTESVINPRAFPARRCHSWEHFKTGNCTDEISYMGYPSERSARGLYYLQTGEDSPYSLGEKGLKYESNGGVLDSVVGGGKHFAKGIKGALG